jgi:hypothetical protein
VTPERLRRLRVELDRLLALPQPERRRELTTLRATDPGLAAAVATALATADGDDPTFEPLLEAPPLAAAATAPQAGARLGPWRLLEPLGSGGMGEVWLAERADGAYTQRVAVKLPHAAALTASAVARFERERNLLAELDLPSIARLVDGGWTGPGQPWLAMEYVPGRRIDAYADHHGLTTRPRVQLLLAACRTLAAAHSRRIVHRDLKPQNLLVRDDGTVVLVDFGIAATLDQPPTSTNHLATPKYAAPEQLRGEPASTTADVYSLARLGRELVPVADADLAAVFTAASEADPARRTPTAAAFAEELARWLAHHPVSARPASIWHRARLLVRRDPRSAFVIATLAAAAAGLFVASLVLWRREHAERLRADHALAAEAEQHVQIRALVAELVTGVHDRIRTLAGAVPVRNFVLARADEHLARLLPRAEHDAALAAELLGVQLRIAEVRGARTHGHLGDSDGAQRSASAALDLAQRWATRQPEEPHWHRTIAQAQRLLGDLHRNRGDFDAARAAYTAAQQQLGALADLGDARQRAVLALQLGKLDIAQGQLAEGIARLDSATQAFAALLQAAPTSREARRDLAHAQSELGFAATSLGDHERTTQAWQAALAQFAALCAEHPDDSQLARDRIGLALELALEHGYAGRRDEARTAHAAALAEARQLANDDRDNVMAAQLVDRALRLGGRLATALGDHSEAAASHRAAEPGLRAAFATTPADLELRRDLAEVLALRAEAERLQGHVDGVQAAFEEALMLLPNEEALARGDHLAGNLITLAWVGLGNLALAERQPGLARKRLAALSAGAAEWANRFAPLHWPLRHQGALEYALGSACEALGDQGDRSASERGILLAEAEAAFARGLAAAEQLAREGRLHGVEKAMVKLFAQDVARVRAAREGLLR